MSAFMLDHGLPPLHPILVNFTAALLPVSVVSDLLANWTGRESLRATAWWTLFFGTVITPFTALAGWMWFNQMDHADHPAMGLHKWLGTSLVGLLVVLTVWRSRAHLRGAAPSSLYLVVAVLVLLALTVQGHIGGRMSFGTGSEASLSHEHDHDEQMSPTSGPAWKDHIEVGPKQ